jgi:hypothetical protein
MKSSLEKRLLGLERQQDEPMEVRVYWSEDEIPREHRDSVIRLKWPEEL